MAMSCSKWLLKIEVLVFILLLNISSFSGALHMCYLSVYFYGFWPTAALLYTKYLRVHNSVSCLHFYYRNKQEFVSKARICSLLCWVSSQILFVSGCCLSLKTVRNIQLSVLSMIALNIICCIGMIIPHSNAYILPVSLQCPLWLPEINGEICKGQSLQWHKK